MGPKSEVRPAQTDLEIVQIFYRPPRNNISFVQLYRPISKCMHAWVVLESHVINFGAGNEVYQSDGSLCGFQVRADTVHPASAFFFFLAINSSGWDHSLQPFPLVGRFLRHNSPGSPNHFFVLFIDKTWRKARPNLLLSLPRDLIKHTKQWHLCRAPDQWTLSSGDFNHINTSAEKNPSNSPLIKWQTQQFCQLLQLLLVRLICMCG